LDNDGWLVVVLSCELNICTVYALTHSGDVAVLERCLRELGVVPFGRWGGWQYWNTDRIFEEAQKLTL
jgi:hypothetical protein